MFLLRVVDLLALIGLFVQAFLAWVFVAVLAAMRRPRTLPRALGSFYRAFLVLAVALTVMSVRFFRAHDVADSNLQWEDGGLRATVCYAVYMGLKALFVLYLVTGCRQLAGSDVPRRLRRLGWAVAVLLAATPLALPGVDDLLVVQAPVMVGGALVALRALRAADLPAAGRLRLVRWSLLCMAAAWTGHALAVLVPEPLHVLLPFNSFIDLGVQLMLGIGLVVVLLQDAHRRVLVAEQERERLRRSMEKNRNLRALGTVVSGVAHELNNPLTVILGFAEVLQRMDPPPRGAAVIAEQAERCRGIVRNLSALAGQSAHRREPLDVERLAHRVVRGLAPEATAEGRTVRVEPMGGLTCAADRIGLEQVLANLVNNGLQASPPGGVVTVAGRARDDGAEIAVTDAGPGVPAGLRERLFEPFFTTKPPGEGTGLGLSIAEAIVRGHDGAITVTDGPGGRGTTFRVSLPAASAAEPSDEDDLPGAGPPRAERAAGDPAAPARGAGAVLLVDDDAAVREVVREEAERRGWRVREAASAEEALGGPLEEVDAMLCDLRMPGIGGVGFHDRLLAERPQLLSRAVFFTGDLASPESVAFSQRCAQPLLAKPFDFRALFAALDAALDAAAAGAAPADLVPPPRPNARVPG